jgi:hypothetical protein
MEKIPFRPRGALCLHHALCAERAIVPLEKVFLSTRILVAVRSYAFYLYKTFRLWTRPVLSLSASNEFLNWNS